MAQGVLPFQYEAETCAAGPTDFGGLGVYLDLIEISGLAAAGRQGWLDLQMVVGLIALNLVGGDRVEDLERLEADAGFAALLEAVERRLLGRRERRRLAGRFRRGRRRALPSPSAMSAWPARFHDAAEEAKRVAGRAFTPEPTAGPVGLARINRVPVGFLQRHRRQTVATLDMDATLVESHKRQAQYCYKHVKAYQPLNTWWAEHEVIVTSEFRDGNVPAGRRQPAVACRPAGSARMPPGGRPGAARGPCGGRSWCWPIT